MIIARARELVDRCDLNLIHGSLVTSLQLAIHPTRALGVALLPAWFDLGLSLGVSPAFLYISTASYTSWFWRFKKRVWDSNNSLWNVRNCSSQKNLFIRAAWLVCKVWQKMRSRLDTTKPRNEVITRSISTEPSRREFAQKVNGDLDLSSRIRKQSRDSGIKSASFLGTCSFRI